MNLHKIASAAVNAVNNNESITIYQSLGSDYVYGELLPIYAEPMTLFAQVQSESDAALYHAGRKGENTITRRMYVNANADMPPAGIVRVQTRGGDMIQRADGTWWLVDAVLDDFSTSSNWVCVRCVLQVDGPDLSHSPWYVTPESEGGSDNA